MFFKYLNKFFKPNKKVFTEAIIESEERTGKLRFPNKFRKRLAEVIERKKVFFAGGLLIAVNVFGNIINFAFSAYVGRVLTFNDFALISLMGSFYSFAGLFFGPLSLAVNYRCGFLMGKFNDDVGYKSWKYIRKYSLYLGIGLCIIWLILTPFLNSFFKAQSLLLFISFAALIFSGFASGVDKGFLTARLFFVQLSVIALTEPVSKILLAIILTWMHLTQLMYITIPLAFFIAFVLGWIIIIRQKPQQTTISYSQNEITSFPNKFLIISLLSGLSTLSFVGLDIVLAKHYLSPSDAGRYALISLMGKTVYFLGGLATPFLIPLVSREVGANKNTTQTLYLLLFFTFVLCFIGFICFGVFGYITAPLLLGEKARSITSYLSLFLFAMMCFSVSQIFASFYQVKKIYSFPVAGFLLSILQIILIVISHTTVFSIVLAMSFIGIANLFTMVLMHFQYQRVQIIENKLIDFYRKKHL